MRRLFASMLCLFIPIASRAQPNAGGTPVAVRCGSLLNVRTGAITQNAVLRIERGRISAIEIGAPLPAGAVDLPGLTCLPGLIDAHTHLLMTLSAQFGWDDPALLHLVASQTTVRRALAGIRVGAELLNAGITTVRDLGNAGQNGDVALRDAFANSWTRGPRMVVSTRALAPVGGQFGPMTPEAQALIGTEYAVVSGPDEARRAVRQAVYDGADWIKVIVNSGPRTLSANELKAIVDEAASAGRKVAAHATTDAAARVAVEAGVASIEHGYGVSDETLRMMAARKVTLVPTDYTPELNMAMYVLPMTPPQAKADRQKSYEGRAQSNSERIRRAREAGVRVVFGSDVYYSVPGMSRGDASLKVLLAYAQSGMTPLEVIRTATLTAAELLEASDRAGNLEQGRYADVIAVEGNPLTDLTALTRLRFVMKAGSVVRAEMSGRP